MKRSLGPIMMIGALLLTQQVLASVAPEGGTALTGGDLALQRQAERLEKRLRKWNISTPSLDAIKTGLIDRRELMKRQITAQLVLPDGSDGPLWDASLQWHPTWLTFSASRSKLAFALDRQRIADTLLSGSVEGTSLPVDIDIFEVRSVDEVLRAQASGRARDGVGFNVESATEQIVMALNEGTQTIRIPLIALPAVLRNHTSYPLDNLRMIASGITDYRGSDSGRIANVKKVHNDVVHNLVIPPDSIFSFNDAIGGPVSMSRGWQMAKVIVKGELENAPGGGICQGSTTTFRALLDAGLPLLQHRSHSIFVSYYEKFGAGLDATVYPGAQDLKFFNDTGHYLLLQATIDGWEATVRVFGIDDGRKVTMEGPYFATNAPADVRVNGRPVRSSEIVWYRTVHYTDGRIDRHQILSQYRYIPQSVVKRNAEISL